MSAHNLALAMLIALLTIFVLWQGVAFLARKRWRERLAALLADKAYAQVDDLISRHSLTRLFPAFSLNMMRLNAYIADEDIKGADALFERMKQERMGHGEAQDFYTKGFYYYLKRRDVRRCADCLKEAQRVLRQREQLAQMEELYRIFLCGDTSDLPVIRRRMEGRSEIECYREEFLIAQIYENMGDQQQAAYYRRQARLHKEQWHKIMEELRFDQQRKQKRVQRRVQRDEPLHK